MVEKIKFRKHTMLYIYVQYCKLSYCFSMLLTIVTNNGFYSIQVAMLCASMNSATVKEINHKSLRLSPVDNTF